MWLPLAGEEAVMTKPPGHATGSTPNPTGPLVETLKFGGRCGGPPAASAVSQQAVATATATAPSLAAPPSIGRVYNARSPQVGVRCTAESALGCASVRDSADVASRSVAAMAWIGHRSRLRSRERFRAM